MKKSIVLFLSLILLIQFFMSSSYAIVLQKQETPISSAMKISRNTIANLLLPTSDITSSDIPIDPFSPSDVTLADDRFHDSDISHYTEWWYFDATFTNNYSLQFSIHVYNILGVGMATINTNLYRAGELLETSRDVFFLSDLILSKTMPYISLNHQYIIWGDTKDDDQKFVYQISYETDKLSFQLEFTSLNRGWKGTTSAGSWAVMIPKARVTGMISYNEQIMEVKGVGYHDHNWNVTVSTGLNYGWAWGRTYTASTSITWASIMETWYRDTPLIVINTNQSLYQNIPHHQITMKAKDFRFTNGIFIPYSFYLTANTPDIYLALNISVLSMDYTTILGIINYWRYHTYTEGVLTIFGETQQIKNYDIAEFICFRFY